ncbi:hypothetical protein HPB50_013820 [Hyalomma asiaticum]|uniref:Uncharacterized protein n=1 Tax=Hyalomma asiaticum TaxID=266040 RepID=A0ACB7T0D6_HYAAI|nr:hypothetical protein HPB50_013820 [Hyalomma asiaticum]
MEDELPVAWYGVEKRGGEGLPVHTCEALPAPAVHSCASKIGQATWLDRATPRTTLSTAPGPRYLDTLSRFPVTSATSTSTCSHVIPPLNSEQRKDPRVITVLDLLPRAISTPRSLRRLAQRFADRDGPRLRPHVTSEICTASPTFWRGTYYGLVHKYVRSCIATMTDNYSHDERKWFWASGRRIASHPANTVATSIQ